MDKNYLINKAYEAQKFSYSPYSNFQVGAALITKSGKIYTGTNIESAAFSPTICAERTAFAKAVSEGEREFSAIAICGSDSDYCVPCGVCLQVMAEFAEPDTFLILSAKTRGDFMEYSLSQLLPYGFKLREEN